MYIAIPVKLDRGRTNRERIRLIDIVNIVDSCEHPNLLSTPSLGTSGRSI